MLAKRIIPCLDVKNGRNVRGVKFSADMDAGDPIELARRYDEEGADELVFYDITASAEKREIVGELVRRVAEQVFIPFTVGGGVRTFEDTTWMVDSAFWRCFSTDRMTFMLVMRSKCRSSRSSFEDM